MISFCDSQVICDSQRLVVFHITGDPHQPMMGSGFARSTRMIRDNGQHFTDVFRLRNCSDGRQIQLALSAKRDFAAGRHSCALSRW